MCLFSTVLLFPDDSDIEHIFMGALAICLSYWRNVYSNGMPIFLIGLFASLLCLLIITCFCCFFEFVAFGIFRISFFINDLSLDEGHAQANNEVAHG